MDRYQIMAYAKINLGLDVVRRLPDGYHQVKMVMQSVGLRDELTFEEAGSGITITADTAELPTGEDNLIHKAARLMLDKYGISSGLRVHLRKNIPIAAGMAGGINHIFHLGLTPAQLMEDGLSIGADVPYCILGGTALAEGIGENLTPLPPMPPCHILIDKPDISVSTKYVYTHLDAQGIRNHPDIDGMTEAIRAGSLPGITERMENVLETVTVPAHPVIDTIKQQMMRLGAAGSLMSGSGPTVFGIFRDMAQAQTALERLLRENPSHQVFLTTPV